jgi:uncharacterized repeat protein (TIGR01451 family)
MKRLVIRLSALSVVVVLGLIAIAQARHGLQQEDTTEKSAAVADSDLPSSAPRPVRIGDEDRLAQNNPLRSRAALAGSGAEPAGRYVDRPRSIQPNDSDVIPPASSFAAPGNPTPAPRVDRQVTPAAAAEPIDNRYPRSVVVQRNDVPTGPPESELPSINPPPNHAAFAIPEGQSPRAIDSTPPAHDDIPAARPIVSDVRPIAPDNQQFDEPRPLPSRFEEPAARSEEPNRFPAFPAAESMPAPASHQPRMDAGFAMPAAEPRHAPGVAGVGRPGPRELEGAQAPSLAIEKTAPTEIQVGKECTFTIHVRNVGQSAAHDVEVIDTVPAGVSLVSASPRAEEGAAGQLIWKIGSLESGEDAKFEITMMPTDEGEIGSVARVRFAAQASARTVSTRPQLALRTTTAPKVMIGDQVALSIELSNPGSGSATGVMLLQNVPEGLEHVAGESLEFEVGTLAPGETRQLELTMTAKQAGIIRNTLTAHADANLEVHDTAEFEVVAPGLAVAVDGPKRRYLDREATYTFSVDNPGTAAAKDVVLTSYLPQGMKFVSANNAGQYDPNSHSVSWGLAELPAKELGEVELVAVPVEAGDHSIRVEGSASQGLSHKAEQNVQVEGLAAILFEVVDVEDPIEVGGETAYEVRVVNQGSAASTNVRIAVLLPPDMNAVSANGPTRSAIEPGRVVFAPLSKLAPKADTTYTIKVQANRPGDQRIRVQVVTDEMRSPVTKEESTRVYSDE